MFATASSWDSREPWAMLIRKTSTPARRSWFKISGEIDAGPTVATVFVRALLRDWTLNLHSLNGFS